MVLVDSSVWIEYFKGNSKTIALNALLDVNTVCLNDLILSELLPSINHKKEKVLKELLLAITKIPLTINWDEIITLQTRNLKYGLNKVGIADLIIAQTVIHNNLELFTLDKHFEIMSSLHAFRMFPGK